MSVMETYQQESKLYKALMHPVRLAILDLLREGEACVCHMEALLGFRQAYISQHLMVLRESGLLGIRRKGLNIYYRVIRPEIFAVMDAMRSVTGVQPVRPTKIHACNCPNCAAESEPRLIRL